jgi:hypothetical protein
MLGDRLLKHLQQIRRCVLHRLFGEFHTTSIACG